MGLPHFSPRTATSARERVLNRFAGKRPTARRSEEGKQGAASAARAAYEERSVPRSGLCPAEKGLKQLPARRNRAKRGDYMCRECFSGIRTVYKITRLHLWVGVGLPAVQGFLRSCSYTTADEAAVLISPSLEALLAALIKALLRKYKWGLCASSIPSSYF